MCNYYNEEYYKCYLGDVEYSNTDIWKPMFDGIADKIVSIHSPRSVLEIGCAWGYLVSALRERGVEAYGIDISEYAISNVPEEHKEFVNAQSAADDLPAHFPKRYDMVISIEMIEHIYEEVALDVIAKMCEYSDTIILTSSSNDYTEKTHFNVQQPEYWVKKFAEHGFYNNPYNRPTYITKDSFFFYKTENVSRVVEDYERNIKLLLSKNDGFSEEVHTLHVKLADEQVYTRTFVEKNSELQKEYQKLQNENNNRALHEAQLQNVHDSIVNSTSWRITHPLRVIINKIKGNKSNDLNLHEKTNSITNNINQNYNSENSALKENTVDDLIENYMHKFHQPISTISDINKSERRLNFVTDSIEPHSLLGGVATALIIVSKFANKTNMPLRIITRTTAVNPLDYFNIMKVLSVKPANNIEFYSDFDRNSSNAVVNKLPIHENDFFVATSWWSAAAIIKTSLRKRFFYILQEVETYFYPYGDQHYFTSKIMKNPNIDFIVNSEYLWNYFKNTEPNIIANGVYFTPAFSHMKNAKINFEKKSGKYKLFFYARESNPRNLFYTGISILNNAILQGVLNTEEWEICFAGQSVPDFVFCDNSKPTVLGLMDWKVYREFLQTVDLALCLMYTPHPSYPPFDVAINGGVVLTNKHQNKEFFNESDNIITSELDNECMMENLESAITLAKNYSQRKINFEKNKIPENWDLVLEKTLKKMEDCL